MAPGKKKVDPIVARLAQPADEQQLLHDLRKIPRTLNEVEREILADSRNRTEHKQLAAAKVGATTAQASAHTTAIATFDALLASDRQREVKAGRGGKAARAIVARKTQKDVHPIADRLLAQNYPIRKIPGAIRIELEKRSEYSKLSDSRVRHALESHPSGHWRKYR